MKEIGFIFNYARSGGTLLNKLLVNNKNLVVLSEVHPINTYRCQNNMSSIKSQALKWYGLELKSLCYVDQIMEIAEWCSVNNKYLVIRDWSYIDFTKSNLNSYNPPLSSINLSILEKRFKVNKIAFVRDAIDVYLSQGNGLEVFTDAYIKYVKYLKTIDIQIFKYEDLCNNENILNDIYNSLGIISKVVVNLNTDSVVGDTNISRGNISTSIQLLDRKYSNYYNRRNINKNDIIKEANKLFSYKTFYESRNHESLYDELKFRIKRKLRWK